MFYSENKAFAFNCYYRGSFNEAKIDLDKKNDLIPGKGVHPDVTKYTVFPHEM